MPKILAIETAVPSHRYGQDEILDFCESIYGSRLRPRRRGGMFDRAGVATRHLAEPMAYYLGGPSFERRNGDFLPHALRLSARCIRGCLRRAGRDFGDVTHFFSHTTTGLLTPSLEAHLAHSLPFPRTMKRTPLFGVGCAGGAVGLARAAEYLENRPSEACLLLTVELCSLTFRREDRTMAQLVGAALFGDGAAAVMVGGDAVDGPCLARILGSRSVLLPDSLDIMGWRFDRDGMRLVLSARAPAVIERHLPPAAAAFLAEFDLTPADIGTFLFHPGSAKILDACERALGLSRRDTRHSRRFLSRYGNLSSASLPFILKSAAQTERPAPGTYGLAGAFGPGFSCELTLLRFP